MAAPTLLLRQEMKMLGTYPRRIANRALPAVAAAVAVAAVGPACQSRDVAAVDPLIDREQLQEIDVDINRDLDLIFVMDDSRAMRIHHEDVISNFPNFIDALSGIEGGLPNVHIGVLSTDVGADPRVEPYNYPNVDPNCEGDGYDGRLIAGTDNRGCAGVDGNWIVDVEDEDNPGQRITNYDGSLGDAFGCMANISVAAIDDDAEIGGCGFEMPLESLRRSLEHPDNQGFFREGAYLGVIFVIVEDDCSLADLSLVGFEDPFVGLDTEKGPFASFRCSDFGVTCDPVDCEYPRDLRCDGQHTNCQPNFDSPYHHDLDEYVDVITDFLGDPNLFIGAGIFGPLEPFLVYHEDHNNTTYARIEPSCDNDVELHTGDDVYPPNPPVRLEYFLDQFQQRESASICDGDLSGPIDRIAQRFVAAIGSPCIDGQIRQPPECVVADVLNAGTDDEEEILMPQCGDGSGTPCWTLEESPECSEFPSSLLLEIDRGDSAPPPNSTVRARCVADG